MPDFHLNTGGNWLTQGGFGIWRQALRTEGLGKKTGQVLTISWVNTRKGQTIGVIWTFRDFPNLDMGAFDKIISLHQVA